MSAFRLSLLVVAAAAAWGTLSGAKPASAQTVAHQVEVVSLSCKKRMAGVTILSLTVRNTGAAPIRYAKVFVKIGPEVVSTYLRPTTIPAGSLAEAGGYMRAEGDCTLIEIQGQGGTPITVRN